MAVRLLLIPVLLAACVITIAVLSRIELLFVRGTKDVAAPPPPGPAQQRSCYRSLWFRWIPIIFVTAFMGLFAMRFVREHLDFRSDSRNLYPQISNQESEISNEERQILIEEVEQLAIQVLKGDEASSEPIPVTVPRETTENLPPAEPELAASSASAAAIGAESFKVTIFESGAADGTKVAALPDWAVQTGETDGLPRVIATTPFATAADAEAEALAALGRELAASFVKEHPEAAGWTPAVEAVRNLEVIGRRAIEESTVQVGEFTEPVFRSFLEILPPENLGARLSTAWRSDTLNSRLLLVGGGMGLLTLMFASLAGYFRIDAATRGKYRKQLRLGTAALWIAAGSALAIVA